MKPPSEVLAYYERFPEESRLQVGAFRLEFERSKTILTRVLPPPPARIVDVGGAAGAYYSRLEMHAPSRSRTGAPRRYW
jgi:hypothetical protein